MDTLELIDSRQVSAEFRSQAWDLMRISFPLCERRPYVEHKRALEDPDFHADLIVLDHQFAGLLFYWQIDEEYLFIEHFATLPSLRGQKIGARALSKLLSLGRCTILEIDLPEDEISIRRQKFYERLGFVANDYYHVQSAYRPSTPGCEFIVMSHPAKISPAEFEHFRHYSATRVMQYSTK